MYYLENKYYHRVKARFWNYSSLLPWITRWAKKYRGFWFEGKELGSILSLGLILWVKDLKGVFNQIKGELLDLSQLQPKYLPVCSKALNLTRISQRARFSIFSQSSFFLWMFHNKKIDFTKKLFRAGSRPRRKRPSHPDCICGRENKWVCQWVRWQQVQLHRQLAS